MHMLDNTGVMSFETLSSKFNLFDRKQYDNINKAIPQSIFQMSGNLSQNNITPCHPQLLVDEDSVIDIHLSNTVIRNIFIKELYPFHSNKKYIYILFL